MNNDNYEFITTELSEPVEELIVAKAYDETGKEVPLTPEHFEEPLPAEPDNVTAVKEAYKQAQQPKTNDIFGISKINSNLKIISSGDPNSSKITVGGTELTWVANLSINLDANGISPVSATFTVMFPQIEFNTNANDNLPTE